MRCLIRKFPIFLRKKLSKIISITTKLIITKLSLTILSLKVYSWRIWVKKTVDKSPWNKYATVFLTVSIRLFKTKLGKNRLSKICLAPIRKLLDQAALMKKRNKMDFTWLTPGVKLKRLSFLNRQKEFLKRNWLIKYWTQKMMRFQNLSISRTFYRILYRKRCLSWNIELVFIFTTKNYIF